MCVCNQKDTMSGFKLEIESRGHSNRFMKLIIKGCRPFHTLKAC